MWQSLLLYYTTSTMSVCLSTYAKHPLPRHMSLALFYPFTILRNGSLTNLLLRRFVLVSDSKKALVTENDSVTLSVNELLYNKLFLHCFLEYDPIVW